MSLKNFPKDVVMPKQPMTSFMFFNKEHMVKGKAVPTQMKELSEKWKCLSDKQKKPYIQLAEKDNQRYV